MTVVGCSTSQDEAEPVAAEDEAAATVSCGAAKYNEALAHYKNAVAYSKERLAQGVCESEHGYQWEIANEASQAVMICGAFHETIKSSPWAAPVREVLKDSMTLPSLTGELLVIKDSQWQNWTGVEAQLEGKKFWAQANGAVGSAKQIIFGRDGKATFQWVDVWSDEWTVKKEAATYTVEKPNGEKGKRRIVVKHNGLTEAYLLSVEPGYTYNDAPVFTITPEHEGTAHDAGVKMYSLVGECDA
jgi:hypothetical protein